MQWREIRDRYPKQWLVVEALNAHTEGEQRVLDELAVLDTCSDSAVAMQRYLQLHRNRPSRELYVLHTDREQLEVTERRWLGIRSGA